LEEEMVMDREEKDRLERAAKEIRKQTLDAIGFLGVGHIGGSLSIADVLAVLYFKELNVNPSDPRMPDRDRFVLSKGHAGPALYSALALRGFFPLSMLHTLNKGGTNLPSHCDRNKTPGVDMTTGSLGQGLSAACGIAYANRLDNRDCFTYVIVGDGESDEGQIWEAAMFAAHHGMDHLISFTDCNKLQIDGPVASILSIDGSVNADGESPDDVQEDLVAKWRAFGWHCERVDGHDVEAIDKAITAAKNRAEQHHRNTNQCTDEHAAGRKTAEARAKARPTMIILDTIKGKGASFCEGQVGSHNMTFDYEVAKHAIVELDAKP
jgi:transketolase